MQPVEIRLVEPIDVPDIFVTDLPLIEHIGEGNWRFTFAVQQQSLHDGRANLVVATRLVLCQSFVIRAAKAALKAVGYHCICSMKRMIH